MAKSAKSIDGDFSDRIVTSAVQNIRGHYENIASARGSFMDAARREREAMRGIYEGLAARGISQKAAKTEIKIIRAMERIKGWTAELALEDRRMVQRLAQAQGDKRQMALFDDLPPLKAKKTTAPKQADAPKRPRGRPRKNPPLQLVESEQAAAM